MAEQSFFYAVGRRKTAIARVRLVPGAGTVTINERAFENYFPLLEDRNRVLFPLTVTGNQEKFNVTISVLGGGTTGQAGAVSHGISRALTLYEPDLRAILKVAGFLTRDSRVVERKKYGRAKARRSFQFSKR